MHRLLVLLFAFATIPTFAASQPDDEPFAGPDEEDEYWAEFLLDLQILTKGTAEEKYSLVDEEDGLFGLFLPLDEPPDPGSGEWVVATLRDWVGYEEDSWFLHLAMEDLLNSNLEEVGAVFRDLSTHPAPSLRYDAMEWADGMQNPWTGQLWLEEMWSGEHVPWLQARLLELLEEYFATGHLQDCVELMDSPDLELATAAMDCATWHGLPQAGPVLVELIISGRPLHRRAAVWAFLDWLDSTDDDDEVLIPLTEALERLWEGGVPAWMEVGLLYAVHATGSVMALQAARDLVFESTELAQAAIAVLSHDSSPQVARLIIDRAGYGDTSLRVAVLDALDPDSWVSGMGLLIESSLRPGQPQQLRLAAMNALLRWRKPSMGRGMLREKTRPYKHLLQEIADSDGDTTVREKAALALKRWESGREFITFPSAVFTKVLDLALRAPESATSVRCWKAPWQEQPVAVAYRFSSDSGFVEQDRFDDGEVLWRHFHADGMDCWVPDAFTRLILPDEEEDMMETSKSLFEFDLPLERVRSEPFRRLERLHVVSTFDEGEALVGVRLHLHATEEALDTLRSVAGEWSDTLLGDAVRIFLPERVH